MIMIIYDIMIMVIIMASLDDVKKVIKRICSIDNLGKNICFFGGSVPYLYFDKESNREHSDIDILVDEKYLEFVRQLAIEHNLYKPEFDSLSLELGGDYGFKLFINGVYVEFEPMSIQEGMLIRKSFSPDKELAGIEEIPFQELSDLIVELNVDGFKTYCQSPELIKALKEQYKREKDLIDISFIDSQGIDKEKYNRVKKAIELSKTSISSYDELRKHRFI